MKNIKIKIETSKRAEIIQKAVFSKDGMWLFRPDKKVLKYKMLLFISEEFEMMELSKEDFKLSLAEEFSFGMAMLLIRENYDLSDKEQGDSF